MAIDNIENNVSNNSNNSGNVSSNNTTPNRVPSIYEGSGDEYVETIDLSVPDETTASDVVESSTDEEGDNSTSSWRSNNDYFDSNKVKSKTLDDDLKPSPVMPQDPNNMNSKTGKSGNSNINNTEAGSNAKNLGRNRFKKSNKFNPTNQESSQKNFRKPQSGLKNRLTNPIKNKANAGSSKSNFGDSLKSKLGAKSNKSMSNANKTSPSGSDVVDNAAKTGLNIAKHIAGKVAAFIASNPIILAVGILVLFFLFLIIFVVLFFGSSGDGTTQTASASYTCAATTTTSFNLASTSLDKNSFIEKVKAYTPSRGETSNDSKRIDAAYEVFKENAGLIYDMALERGYNPEFVIIRADTEGFSPGYDSYNYWGIGCENGHPEKCVRKDDFASGLSRFFDVFDNYKKPKEEGGRFGIDVSNIYEVMNLYADLGSTWISPGNSSDGGCYYLKYIQPYLSTERYNEVKASCDAGTNIKVTDEDEIAYAKYQVETETIPKRQKIFGLGAEEVKVCSLKEANVNPVLTSDKAGILSSTNVDTFLKSNGTSVTAFNNTLLETVKKDGIGTRQAVVDAAMLLVNTVATYNMKIPYSYYGGWSHYDSSNPNDHNYNVNSYYGMNPYFGEEIYEHGRFGHYVSSYNKTYYYLGLDCSGFVTWSLHNGGVNHRLDRAKCYKISPNERTGIYAECGSDGGSVKAYPADSKAYIGKAGDVLSSDSHVMLVLKYNDTNESYIFAEAGGKDKGILIRERKLSGLSNYKIVDMSEYYTDSFTNKNYEKEFQEKRLDKPILNQAR